MTFAQRHSEVVVANDCTHSIQNPLRGRFRMGRSPGGVPNAGEKGFKGVDGGRISLE